MKLFVKGIFNRVKRRYHQKWQQQQQQRRQMSAENWYYACTAFVVFLLYLNYNLIKLRGEESSSTAPRYKVSASSLLQKRTDKMLDACCNPLLCSLEGTWSMRNNVGFSDYRSVEDTNMKLRTRKGWPSKLIHGDLRCGIKYPLARSVRHNNSNFYLLDIVSQCDSLSNAPCCRDDIGWCGRGDWYCKCSSCFDYENVIHAELAEWKHSLNCARYNSSYLDTCDFLSSQFSSILFIGDSLVRHLFSSLLIHLTNDTRAGALKHNIHENDKNFCGFENQFVDSSCHVKLATDWEVIRVNKDYCKDSYLTPKLSFVEAYSVRHKDLALQTIRAALQELRPLIIIGIGIHDNFNSMKVISEYLYPLVELRNQYGAISKPVIVWLNTHAAGPLKPMGYKELQGNESILRFNSILTEYCRQNSILTFDTFNITKDVHSFDGTHYGSSLNKLKVELLLGALQSLS